jgi:hydroxysqualene synthase
VVSAFVPAGSGASLARAYAHCGRMAREHYENFPVASLLLPPRMRPAVAAVYAFARRADDFADEGTLARNERLRLLDGWEARLHGRPDPDLLPDSGDELIFAALDDAIARHGLPLSLFSDLLSAFRQDVLVTRYQSWDDVLDYCARSANPVGRLVLRIAGHRDAGLDRASDALCTALQLTNFWQDFGRDWANGRLYVPLADRDRAGAREEDLDAGRMTPAWREALAGVAGRTRELFALGKPVCDGVRGRLRFELRCTWLGGTRILERIERAEFDVLGHRPALGAADAPRLLWRVLAWKGA